MRFLVTGGAGFIGSHLAQRLVEAGHEVVVYDAFTKLYPSSAKRRNIAPALELSGCSLIEGDVFDEQRLGSVFSPQFFDAVFHLAAWPGAHASLANPRLFSRYNITGTLNVLEHCKQHGVGRVVFASSAAVYGVRREGPLRETDATDRPVSPYGVSKKAAEMLCYLYHHLHGLRVSCLRLFSVYGPRQRPDQSMHRFARAFAAGETVAVRGGGTSVRDPVFVDDAVDAFVGALEIASGFEVINVGTGRGVTVSDLAARAAAALGTECRLGPADSDPADQPYAVADVRRAADLLSWKPAVDLDEGLARFATWFRAQEFEDEA